MSGLHVQGHECGAKGQGGRDMGHTGIFLYYPVKATNVVPKDKGDVTWVIEPDIELTFHMGPYVCMYIYIDTIFNTRDTVNISRYLVY